MSIEFTDIENIRHVTISGALDIVGTQAISIKFAALAASDQRRVIVDLTGVNFLASFGIRDLLINAKAQDQRGGKYVLYVGSNDHVIKTLETTGIDQLIPMFTDADEAKKAVLA